MHGIYNRLIKNTIFLYKKRETVVNVDNILSFVSNSTDTYIVLAMIHFGLLCAFVCVFFFPKRIRCLFLFLCDTKQIIERD